MTEDHGSYDSGATSWSGPRPLVRGTPVVVGVTIALLAFGLLAFLLSRQPGLASRVSAHYVDVMAGELTAEIRSADPAVLSREMAGAGLPFAPRITGLDPEFDLLGGTVHELDGRPIGAWFYQNARADVVLVEAFMGSIADLGEPGQVRSERAPSLHLFQKSSQTLLFWEEGDVVYALVSTLPAEHSVALARRLAAGVH